MRTGCSHLGSTVWPGDRTGRWCHNAELVARLGHHRTHRLRTWLPDFSLSEATTFYSGPAGSGWHHWNSHQQQHAIVTWAQMVGRHKLCTFTETCFYQRYSDLQRVGTRLRADRYHQFQCARTKLPSIAVLSAYIECQRIERWVDVQIDYKFTATTSCCLGHCGGRIDHFQIES